MDIGKLKVDSAKIDAGDWVGDIPGLPGVRLKVRGFTSASYRAALQKAQRGIAQGERNRDGSLPVPVSDRISAQALHEAALIDWQGLEQDGKPLPFDAEIARALLTDPDYRAFRDAVTYAANEVDGIKKEAEAAVLGN